MGEENYYWTKLLLFNRMTYMKCEVIFFSFFNAEEVIARVILIQTAPHKPAAFTGYLPCLFVCSRGYWSGSVEGFQLAFICCMHYLRWRQFYLIYLAPLLIHTKYYGQYFQLSFNHFFLFGSWKKGRVNSAGSFKSSGLFCVSGQWAFFHV